MGCSSPTVSSRSEKFWFKFVLDYERGIVGLEKSWQIIQEILAWCRHLEIGLNEVVTALWGRLLLTKEMGFIQWTELIDLGNAYGSLNHYQWSFWPVGQCTDHKCCWERRDADASAKDSVGWIKTKSREFILVSCRATRNTECMVSTPNWPSVNLKTHFKNSVSSRRFGFGNWGDTTSTFGRFEYKCHYWTEWYRWRQAVLPAKTKYWFKHISSTFAEKDGQSLPAYHPSGTSGEIEYCSVGNSLHRRGTKRRNNMSGVA